MIFIALFLTIGKKSRAFINRKWFHKLLYFYCMEYYAVI